MTLIALSDAQSQLPDIVAAVADGQEFVITLDGKPIVRMTQAKEPTRRIPGRSRGKVHMAEDFDAPLKDFAEYM